MCKGHYEAVMANAINARYYGGDRSSNRQRIKRAQRQEFVVIGWLRAYAKCSVP